MIFELLAGQCANVVVPEATAEAMRYYRSGNLLWILDQAVSLIIPLLFLIGGFTGKLESFAKRCSKNWFFTIIAYLFFFILISQILNFPLDFYESYTRNHEYGLSHQSLSAWFNQYGKEIAITLISSFLFVWIFYLLLKKSPKRWWFYGSIVSMLIMTFSLIIQPIWIEPLFDDFGPMKNKELEAKILSLAARAGIPNSKVFEVNKSDTTSALNAYVSGIGGTGRVVLWDTTIDALTTDELLFVVGHEMGHYVLHHILIALIYYSLITFFVFYLTYRGANFIVDRYSKALGFKNLYQIASLPLLLFFLNVFMLLLTPLSNYVSRKMELEADRFGLEITHNNEAAGTAFLTLQKQNLANPRPGKIYTFWQATHPSIGDRVDFFNNYCPWKQNAPVKYGKYFSSEAKPTE